MVPTYRHPDFDYNLTAVDNYNSNRMAILGPKHVFHNSYYI